ncbi:hypothetical protein D3C75_870340 [compost metagenome]
MNHFVAGSGPAGLDGPPDLRNLWHRQHPVTGLSGSAYIPGPQTHHVGHVDRAAASMPVEARLQCRDHSPGYPWCPLTDGIEIAQPHVHGDLVDWPFRQAVLHRREGIAIIFLGAFSALPHHVLLEPLIKQGCRRRLVARGTDRRNTAFELIGLYPGLSQGQSRVPTERGPNPLPVDHMPNLERNHPLR